MSDLKREMRDAFEREQAKLGELTGVRQRMLRTALTAREPRRSQLFRTALGLAAVLVAAAAVGTTVYLRAKSQPGPVSPPSPSASVQASPSATPAPTAVANPLQVPATTPVLIYHDPVNGDQVDGITWDGTASGRIAASGGTFGLIANPTGTLYAGFQDSGIHDRTGQVVSHYGGTYQKGFAGTWADDGRHYCQMTSASPFGKTTGEPAALQLIEPGQPARTIAQVGTAYEQGILRLPACSVLADRAVVVQSGGQGVGTAQFWVVQLSTGWILWTRSYGLDASTVEIRASRDGQYIAEVPFGTGVQSQTTVYGPSGSVAGRVAGAVEAFSWDGTVAVVSGPGGAVSVINWHDGTHVWSAPQGTTFYAALPEPGGPRIAVALRNPAYQQTTGFPPIDLYVASPDGTATLLLQKVEI